MLKKVIFVLNPISGINRRPEKIVQWIKELWEDAGVGYEILKTTHRGQGVELAREAAAAGAAMVVAAGGDGTINEIGRGLIGSDTALGIIPAGSGNGFARNIDIPLDQKKAIALLKNPAFKKFDAGKINDHYFFNVAGSGLDAEVTAGFAQSPIRGPVPYFLIGVREYFRFEPQPMIIKMDHREIRRTPMMISFANLPEFGVNATIAPNARPDDGLLDICIINPLSLWRSLIHSHKLFNGRIEEIEEVEIYRARNVKIFRFNEGPIHTDGDLHFEGAQLNIQVLPGQLKVAVPPE